jgi:hypothetical protein
MADEGRLKRWEDGDEALGYNAAVLDDDYQPRNAVTSIEVTRASKDYCSSTHSQNTAPPQPPPL